MENEKETKDPETEKETNTQETGGRTFTQEEVNRIVSERLGRERGKVAADLEEREKAVHARELAVLAAEKLAEVELPKELASVLRYDDESSLEKAIQTLSKLRGFSGGKKVKSLLDDGYEVIPNKLPKGEPNNNGVDFQIQNAFKPPKD